jgi:hypothetical protein
MKVWPLLLAASLALNVALAAAFAVRSSAFASGRPGGGDPARSSGTTSTVHPPPAVRIWEDLVRGGDQDWMTRLRAEGFPPAVIRAMAFERLHQRFQERRRALDSARKVPFWRSDPFNFGPSPLEDPNIRAQRRALDREYEQAVQDLLGTNANEIPDDQSRLYRRQYGDLPLSRIRQIEAVNRDYSDLRTQVREEMQGITLPEDQEKLDLIEQERRADLAQIGSPENSRPTIFAPAPPRARSGVIWRISTRPRRNTARSTACSRNSTGSTDRRSWRTARRGDCASRWSRLFSLRSASPNTK